MEVVAVGSGDLGVVASQDFEDESLHAVGVERVSERHHLVQDAAKGPNVRLLVVRLFLADFRR